MPASPQRSGLILAICAFTLWGIAPIYFKAVAHIAPLEVLAHRVLWSVLILIGLITLMRQWPQTKALLRDPKRLGLLVLSSALIALNWLIFIWAVGNNQLVEATLGYFINPLINVVLGFLFFHERLNRAQKIAVALALIAISYELLSLGELPLVALGLALSFSLYSFVRKKIAVAAVPGLAIETTILLPLSLGFLVYLANTGESSFALHSSHSADSLLLLSAGLVTTIPLILFNAAAPKLSLSTLGFVQYLGPSIAFCLAIFVYDEDFSADRLIVFLIIWLGLLIFTLDAWHRQRNIKLGRSSKTGENI